MIWKFHPKRLPRSHRVVRNPRVDALAQLQITCCRPSFKCTALSSRSREENVSKWGVCWQSIVGGARPDGTRYRLLRIESTRDIRGNPNFLK